MESEEEFYEEIENYVEYYYGEDETSLDAYPNEDIEEMQLDYICQNETVQCKNGCDPHINENDEYSNRAVSNEKEMVQCESKLIPNEKCKKKDTEDKIQMDRTGVDLDIGKAEEKRMPFEDDTPMTEETVLSMSMSSSLVGLTPGLLSGHLLSSLKSRCGCCGSEKVNPSEVPDELLAHGIQIHPDEYSEALQQLMCESKFRCHIWCYNMPLAITFFTALLGLCLFLIPIVEQHFLFQGSQLGMEYLHGAVVWLCFLTLYMFSNHIARRKMKQGMYQKLSKVNTLFIKYNILVGVENLGIADCNKYYIHFFYYELGPCLAYLQELLSSIDDCAPNFTNHVMEGDNGTIELDLDDHGGPSCDGTVLNGSSNFSVQNQAEDLLLDNSGEYIYRLITKKLDRPHKQRHVKGSYCLCQYVEHRVYKVVV